MPDEALLTDLWLTKHFSVAELTDSQEAERRRIQNVPGPDARRNLLRLALWLEDLRALLGGMPILVSSGYRSLDLNTAIKGSKKSLHMQGLAADFTAPRFGSPLDVCRFIAGLEVLQFDELIYEGKWVHVGLAPESKPKPARRVLTARFVRGRPTTYTTGLPQ
jgi:hypothetical protein